MTRPDPTCWMRPASESCTPYHASVFEAATLAWMTECGLTLREKVEPLGAHGQGYRCPKCEALIAERDAKALEAIRAGRAVLDVLEHGTAQRAVCRLLRAGLIVQRRERLEVR